LVSWNFSLPSSLLFHRFRLGYSVYLPSTGRSGGDHEIPASTDLPERAPASSTLGHRPAKPPGPSGSAQTGRGYRGSGLRPGWGSGCPVSLTGAGFFPEFKPNVAPPARRHCRAPRAWRKTGSGARPASTGRHTDRHRPASRSVMAGRSGRRRSNATAAKCRERYLRSRSVAGHRARRRDSRTSAGATQILVRFSPSAPIL